MGQLTDARVRIFIRGSAAPIGDATAGFSHAPVAIAPPQLTPEQTAEATQVLRRQTSEKPPEGVVVEAAASGPVTLPRKLYARTQSIFVTNRCPGARLEAWQGTTKLVIAVPDLFLDCRLSSMTVPEVQRIRSA